MILGFIGAGVVGGATIKLAEHFGHETLIYDPPRGMRDPLLLAEAIFVSVPVSNNPSVLAEMAKCFREKAIHSKDEKEKVLFINEAMEICKFIRNTSMELAPQALTHIYNDQSKIPMPGES